MRILGLDVGEKTIGVAISDALGWTAQGLSVIRRKSWAADLAEISQIVQQYSVSVIIVGMPRRTDGSYGPEATRVRGFADRLGAQLPVELKYQDERFSTVAAERALLEGDVSRRKRKEVIDMVAASVILQAYLDRS